MIYRVNEDIFINSDITFLEDYLNNNSYILIKPNEIKELPFENDYMVINESFELDYLNLGENINNLYIVGSFKELSDNDELKEFFFLKCSNDYSLLIQKENNCYVSSITKDNYTLISEDNIKIPLENIPVVSAGGRTIITSLENLSNVIKNSDIDDNKEVMMTK